MTLRRRQARIKNLESLISDLKKKNLLTEEAQIKIEAFGELPAEIIEEWRRNVKRPKTGRRYSAETRKFAMTLHFYSPRAYEYVAKNFPMPSTDTLREWVKVVGAWPGFTQEVLDHLKVKHQNSKDSEKLCSIMLDGMSIRKKCEADKASGRLIGYVDFGEAHTPEETDDAPLASDALVFMVVGTASPWKIPFGYFLNKGLSGEVLRNLLVEAITAITNCGLEVVAVVCDALSSNVMMGRLLGCHIHARDASSFRTYFPHPCNSDKRVYLIFDAAHGLKLLRNLFGDSKVLHSSHYGVRREILVLFAS